MKKTSRYLKAIADPTRLKILKLLQHRTSCVCELAQRAPNGLRAY
ncbi:MAG: winged helix-turn-helix transcriptional regulator [Deltaproteobacteria bacterium]|nr:winged helix-turn-helix transcriptional regulator [Deltaproteobacteria bacterium]